MWLYLIFFQLDSQSVVELMTIMSPSTGSRKLTLRLLPLSLLLNERDPSDSAAELALGAETSTPVKRRWQPTTEGLKGQTLGDCRRCCTSTPGEARSHSSSVGSLPFPPRSAPWSSPSSSSSLTFSGIKHRGRRRSAKEELRGNWALHSCGLGRRERRKVAYLLPMHDARRLPCLQS